MLLEQHVGRVPVSQPNNLRYEAPGRLAPHQITLEFPHAQVGFGELFVPYFVQEGRPSQALASRVDLLVIVGLVELPGPVRVELFHVAWKAAEQIGVEIGFGDVGA